MTYGTPMGSLQDASRNLAGTTVAVESPSTCSSNALARFEYESGKTKDCTKVLMVEWEDDEHTREVTGEWTVTWQGKRTIVPARDPETRGISRLYFLLPSRERVPPQVTLTLTPDPPSSATAQARNEPVVWKANPLPAIFPPELGTSAREAGRKGVLHTLWAKRRLQVLSKEIEAESAQDGKNESLTLALQERDWIESNFGVTARPRASPSSPQPAASSRRASLSPVTPGVQGGGDPGTQSPRTPGGSRLMSKLQGLKLATGDKNLQSPLGDDDPLLRDNLNPLSPEQSDVAVSSFGAFAELKGMPDQSTLAAKAPQRTVPWQDGGDFMSSLGSIADGKSSQPASLRQDEAGEGDMDEGLFALPLSPRKRGVA